MFEQKARGNGLLTVLLGFLFIGPKTQKCQLAIGNVDLYIL